MASNKNKRRPPAGKAPSVPKNITLAQERRLTRMVIKRQESQLRKDMEDLKRAKLQATSVYEPRQLLLQTLYDVVMEDPLMTSQVSVLRVGKSQAVDFILKMNGEPDEAETQKLKDSGLFEDVNELVVESNFYNNSLLEFEYTANGDLDVDLIPRKHVSPEDGRFYPDAAGATFVEYRDLPEFGKWLVEVYPRKRDLGLLVKAVPYVLMKRFAVACWSELCEIFGIPPRVLKTNTQDDDMLARAERMMREIGSAAYFIIDSNEEFSFANRSETNGDVYKNLITTCNQELSLLNLAAVIGQDTVHGGRSKEESSAELFEAVIKADHRLVEATWNKRILPALAAIGFIKPGLRLEIAKEVDVQALWKMTHEAAQYWEIDHEWVRDTFGIEVIGAKAHNVLPPADDPDDDPDPDDDTNPGGTPPAGDDPDPKPNQTTKTGEPVAVFLNAPLVGAFNGSAPTEFNERLIDRVANGVSPYFDAELFWWIAADLLNGIKTVFKTALVGAAPSVSYAAPDDVYTAAMEQNIFHFSAAKTLAEVQELNQAFRASANYNDFKNRAATITSTFNDKWQKTEYRTAIQVAESASNYRSLRSQTKLFPYWRYRTAGDGHVRPEHAALDNLTLPASDPLWRQIYPPNDWNCRCTVEPIMKDEHEGGFEEEYLKVAEFQKTSIWKKAVAQGWGVNRAESAEVFDANQMYIKKFPDKAKKLVGGLHYNDYGLDSFGKRLAAATAEFVPYEGKAADWLARNGKMKDFSGKTIDVSERMFKDHTTGSHAARVSLLNSVPDVLMHPDEVWLNNYQSKFNNLNYIKYYQGKCINVICGVDGSSIRVNTWFEIEQNPRNKKLKRKDDPRWRYRRGLLIKK